VKGHIEGEHIQAILMVCSFCFGYVFSVRVRKLFDTARMLREKGFGSSVSSAIGFIIVFPVYFNRSLDLG